MSDEQFNAYLRLMSGLLRLRPDQRQAIAAELRDHMEERLADLLAQGCEREQAVTLALDEFGDAAGLAAQFTQLQARRKRRCVMRATAGSLLTAAAAVLVVVSLLPGTAPQSPAPSFSQGQTKPPAIATRAPEAAPPATRPADDLLAATTPVSFQDVPLKEALVFLSDASGADFFVKWAVLETIGVAPDRPVSLKLTHRVRCDTALSLLLEAMVAGDGDQQLGYVVHDGIVIISTVADLTSRYGTQALSALQQRYRGMEVRVYDCLDLAPPSAVGASSRASSEVGGMGPTSFSRTSPAAGNPLAAEPGATGGAALPAALAWDGGLAALISNTVAPESWVQQGGVGTIAEYHGLLVVRHTPTVHQEVEQLLVQLRAAMKKRLAAAK